VQCVSRDGTRPNRGPGGVPELEPERGEAALEQARRARRECLRETVPTRSRRRRTHKVHGMSSPLGTHKLVHDFKEQAAVRRRTSASLFREMAATSECADKLSRTQAAGRTPDGAP
jgi:hypothetical protein